MTGYKRPKKRLHREFAYLNYDSIVNSLSAFQAGQVDEIIQKTSEAQEGGLGGKLGTTGMNVSASKKKQATIQEELVRTRTWFSAFDSWLKILEEQEALGSFKMWDTDVRNELSIGDTIIFQAELGLSPIHKLFAVYTSYAESTKTGNIFNIQPKQIPQLEKTARMMEGWISDKDGSKSFLTYFQPVGSSQPRIIGRLLDRHLINGLDGIEGKHTVVGQVSSLLESDDTQSVLRLLRNAPPPPKEQETVTEALTYFRGAGEKLGIDVTPDDISFSAPDVLVHPIAIYK